ncbi:transglycosylase domain-containing protein [Methyloceanibacter superfactus]|uniref:transglycosylase domain-containing protein n=1 Tax=Methyloceanibacter superfactus TaxID=1774969 RepID=UPI000849CEA1|nr:PBP1A family penicillin-binding protein [Methyloceanibacter superfactus]
MRDFLQGNRRGKLIDWLKIDSWIDSGLYGAWIGFRDWWSAYSSFFGRFEIKGFLRACNELACESLTLSVAGLLVVLTFALPAFEIAQGKINLSDEYSVTFLDRYGNEIGKRGLLRDDSVPLEEIPDHMIKATLATEDRRFFDHFGIDVMGTFRALAENARADSVVQGGSSLTQQLAKNMFLTPEKALARKIKEAFIAVYLENHYTKPEILKLYFDRAYLGGGSYGVEAAAQYYFGKSIREVTLPESAMLAGMFKAPTRYAPHVNLAASRARANEVLSNMVEAGYLSEGQVYGARLNPARIVERGENKTPDYFLDWAFEEVQRLMHGKPNHILVARTTVDLGLQKAAENALEDTVNKFGRSRNFNNGALVSMETDGAVRAMVGGKDYGSSQFNRAAHAYRQPGSSFKPYVYLAALEHGYTPDSTVSDGYVSCGRWSPKNYSGGFRGRMSLRTALAKSINTVAVKLSLEVDRGTVLANMEKMGIKHLKKTCSMALGDNGMTPLEHVGGYAVFAAGGLEVRPYAIEEIRTIPGDLLYNHDRDEPPRKQIFDPKAVAQLNSMLQTVVNAGTGRRAQLDYTNAVGKTGTSSAYRDAWFMGFTGQYVTGVWYGNDDFTPMARVTGGSFPAETWKAFMTAAHDTDNIPNIPGVDPHPLQVAEQARIAAVMSQNTNAELPVPPPAENVKDMSTATRQVLQKLSELLKDAPRLKPNGQALPGRAETPAAGSPSSSLASAANTDGTPPPAPAPAATEPENAASVEQNANAPVPQ